MACSLGPASSAGTCRPASPSAREGTPGRLSGSSGEHLVQQVAALLRVGQEPPWSPGKSITVVPSWPTSATAVHRTMAPGGGSGAEGRPVVLDDRDQRETLRSVPEDLDRKELRAKPRPARGQAGKGLRPVDEGLGQIGQAAVAGPGMVSQEGECLIHAQAEALGELAFGLLDDDPAVQRELELLVEGVAMLHAALVQQADGGHVGQGLPEAYVRRAEGPRAGAEEVQRADDLLTQPHRQGLHGGEPAFAGDGGEPGPALRLGTQIGGGDGLAAAEAVQAGTLVVL